MLVLDFAALIQSIIMVKAQINCSSLRGLQIQVNQFQNFCQEHIIICHFSRGKEVYFSTFLTTRFQSKTGYEAIYFQGKHYLLSSDSYLEVRINGVKVCQSFSKLGVPSNKTCVIEEYIGKLFLPCFISSLSLDLWAAK